MRENLAILDQILVDILPSAPIEVKNSLEKILFASGAKRIRPKLCFTLAGIFQKNSFETKKLPREVHIIAAVTEILHLASLVHDDVVDNAKQRRQVKTLNTEFGKKKAVLIGDYLVAQAMVLASNNLPKEIFEPFPLAIRAMSLTELLDQKSSSMRSYLRHISAKTASLFLASTQAISRFYKVEANPFTRFAYQFGMAFQMHDDVLDFIGRGTGKKRLIDLENGSPNIIKIIAASHKYLNLIFTVYAKFPPMRPLFRKLLEKNQDIASAISFSSDLIRTRLSKFEEPDLENFAQEYFSLA